MFNIQKYWKLFREGQKLCIKSCYMQTEQNPISMVTNGSLLLGCLDLGQGLVELEQVRQLTWK